MGSECSSTSLAGVAAVRRDHRSALTTLDEHVSTNSRYSSMPSGQRRNVPRDHPHIKRYCLFADLGSVFEADPRPQGHLRVLPC